MHRWSSVKLRRYSTCDRSLPTNSPTTLLLASLTLGRCSISPSFEFGISEWCVVGRVYDVSGLRLQRKWPTYRESGKWCQFCKFSAHFGFVFEFSLNEQNKHGITDRKWDMIGMIAREGHSCLVDKCQSRLPSYFNVYFTFYFNLRQNVCPKDVFKKKSSE